MDRDLIIMFNLGGGEIILIGLLAIILIPPKKIPEVAVSLGKFFRQLQHSFDDVKVSMEKSLKEESSSEAGKPGLSQPPPSPQSTGPKP